MTLTLAIAGCGGMARRHLLGLEKLKGLGRLEFDLVAVADPVVAQREGLADRARELLGRRPETYASTAGLHAAHPDLDAFDVSTSPDTHEEVGVEALAAGAHVMVEKPIALTVEQGLRLVRAADEAGLKLAVAENYRRDPINRLVQALVDAGALGRVFLAVQSSSSGGEKVIITTPLAPPTRQGRHRPRHGRPLRRRPRVPAGPDRHRGGYGRGGGRASDR